MKNTDTRATSDIQEEVAGDASGPQLVIQQIYIKDLSFESPAPRMQQGTQAPQVEVQLTSQHLVLAEQVFEVELAITVTAKTNDAVTFLVEVHQAGIFQIIGLSGPQLNHALGSYCPTVLFPYAREIVSDLIVRGGFPPLYLAPINFDALYEQQLKKASHDQVAGPPIMLTS